MKSKVKEKEIKNVIEKYFDFNKVKYSIEQNTLSIFENRGREVIVGMYDFTLNFWAYIHRDYEVK